MPSIILTLTPVASGQVRGNWINRVEKGMLKSGCGMEDH